MVVATPTAVRSDDVLAQFEALADRIQRLGYRGWEFDDFLCSPLVRGVCRGNLFAQRVAIQLGERLPLNLRGPLRIPRQDSTKANGFFALGYLHAYRGTGDERWLGQAEARLRRLLATASPGYAGLGWGNAFDFASRAGFLPAGVPTVVWTGHISRAFALAYELTGTDAYGDAVVACGTFVRDELERREDADGICIAYAPGLPAPVHNSNLLGAATLLRAWVLDRDEEKLDVAGRAFAWSLARMLPDGGWPYGEGPLYGWIDNFHTAYVIDALRVGHALAGPTLVPPAAMDASYRYWREAFFREDGTPRYYHDRTYPLNIQCAAQAIATLATSAEDDPLALSTAHRVLVWTNRNLRRRDGLYMYRRTRLTTNRLASIHWGQSTMLDALGLLVDRSGGDR